MKWLRKSMLVGAIATGALAAGAWIASYFWWPLVTFPWPTSGLRQTHDAGFLLLIEGRIVIVRQRVDEALHVVAIEPGATPPLRPQPPPRDASIPPTAGSYAVDSRTLMSMTLGYLHEKGTTTIGASDPRTHYRYRPWRNLGFGSRITGRPNIVTADLMVNGIWSATTVPLWPLLIFAAPAAIYLSRNRRSVRWAREGLCRSCGYDLRESPDRCSECGRAVEATIVKGTGS
jgi:hypothetical protein